jgi:hypothetical protein
METQRNISRAEAVELRPQLAIATRTPAATAACRRALIRLGAHYPGLSWNHVPMTERGKMLIIRYSGDAPPGCILGEFSNAVAAAHSNHGDDWIFVGPWAEEMPHFDEDAASAWLEETLG